MKQYFNDALTVSEILQEMKDGNEPALLTVQ